MLAAIVFTDVVGFSALMQRNEAKAMHNVERDFRLMTEIAEQHGGQVLKRTGDGLLISYTSAVEAVNSALLMQKRIAEVSQHLNFDDIMVHRVGIHLGDVLMTEYDVLGDGVNVAQRLQAEARPGAICLSQTVLDVVKGKTDASPNRLGPRSLKGILEPVVVWEIPPVGAHSTENVLTQTAPRDMGDLKLNLEPESTPMRGAFTIIALLVAVCVPIFLGVWMVQRTTVQQKAQAKLDAEQRRNREAAQEAKRNQTVAKPNAPVPPANDGPVTPTPPVTNGDSELEDPNKTFQGVTQQGSADLGNQLTLARNSYDFEKCQQLLTQSGLDKTDMGAALIRHYGRCASFMSWVDASVAQLTQASALKFPGASPNEETLVYGDKGLVVIDRNGSVETNALKSMTPDAILKIGRSLHMEQKEKAALRAFAREFGQFQQGD